MTDHAPLVSCAPKPPRRGSHTAHNGGDGARVIDLERVIYDPEYRARILDRLNRRAGQPRQRGRSPRSGR